MTRVDMNCDLGESFGNFKIGNDEMVLPYVTSVNIACGYHAGDPLVMQKTVGMALEHQVAIGAHPGFPDLLGFGRRQMTISPEEAKAYVMYQVGALYGFVKAAGGKMQHVKPHGAFYNMAANDYELAKGIAEGVYAIDPDLILMGLAGGELVKAGKDTGLQTASEVFGDRRYTPEGKLVDRRNADAVIHDPKTAADQIVDMVMKGRVTATDGSQVELEADSICVHGDNAEALELVKGIREALSERDIRIEALR